MSKLIQWPTAKYWTAQWNPVIGCKPCSPACEHCYAAAWAKRFGQSFEPHKSSQTRPPRKGVVFCGNMTDLFGGWNIIHENGAYHYLGMDYIASAVGGNRFNPIPDKGKATYLWLTKRPENMCECVNGGWDDGYDSWAGDCGNTHDFTQADLRNHYFGFTAENQEWYEKRLQLRATSAPMFPDWANLWVSCEPLLGPIDLGLIFCGELVKPVYKWIVVGCESGPNRRPCKIEWVESIVEQCRAAGVPVFVKQLDIGGKCVADISKFPEHLRIRHVPWAKKGGAK